MTIEEKENYIGRNLKNYPYLSDGNYNVRFYICVFDDYTRFELYEDTEYVDSPTVLSKDTNYSLFTNDTDNGNINREYLFNVDYLFKDETGNTEESFYSCPITVTVSDEHNISFNYYDIECDDDSGDICEHDWNIVHNGYENEDYQVYEVSIDPNNYHVIYPDSGNNLVYSSLSDAQNVLRDRFINDGYPSASTENIYTKYNPILRQYVDCLSQKVDQCCLLWC